MSLRPPSNVVPESAAVASGGQRYEVAGHGAVPLGAVAMFHSADNMQIEGSTLSVAGRDVIHHHYHNYHSEPPRDILGILQLMPNFRKIYQDMMSKATPGTGMWLVKGFKFSVWLEPNGDIKILWGSGIPGAGKTLLASIVIKHLEALYPASDAKICICYVYFRYSDHSRMMVRTILETLVMQTLERHPQCKALIQQAYAQHLRERTEPTEEQLLVLLRELTDCMLCTFYILDALDEAPIKIQLAIVRALASLNVKLFITSRPLQPLEAHFPQAHTFPIVAQDADLDLHITKGVNESVELQRLLQTSPSLGDEILSTIKQNCGGMFLHASLQLDALHDCINAHQVRKRLQDFPSTIQDVYLHTWDRILGQNADLVTVAETVLVWVLNASRSMTVDELECAVARSPDTHKFEPDRLVPGSTLMSLCRGLIAVEEESRIVRLVHYTAKETLEQLLHESFPHPHSLLAAVCMANLAECGFQNTTISSEEEFEAALGQDPLLDYASEAWVFHAGRSWYVDDIKDQIAQFVCQTEAFPAFTRSDHIWSRDFDILTPLHIVSFYRLPLALIGHTIKGNPNARTSVRQQSPLMLASLSGHESIVKLLLAHPEIQAHLVNVEGTPALMLAASGGHEGVVELLLAHPEIQVNIVNNHGWSALMPAASRGHAGVVRLLLAHPEIQVNLADNSGWTALILAASEGNESVVKLLLLHPRIQVNLVDKEGSSALMQAARKGHEGVIKLFLLHPGIQVHLVDNEGSSALMLAACWGNEGVVKLLLPHPETQVNLVNNNGQSALMLAAREGYQGIVKLLLAHPDIQVNLATNHGSTALLLAAEHGHVEIVTLLLTTGTFDINTFDNDRDTAIKMAANNGYEAIVHLLLNVPNVDIAIRSINDGHTAMSAAQANGHSAIVELLQDFEPRRGVIDSPPEVSRLSLHDEDGSYSDGEEVYYDAEEGAKGVSF